MSPQNPDRLSLKNNKALEELGKFLQTAREKLRLSRFEVSSIIRLDPRKVEQWEAGQLELSPRELLHIGEVLKVTESEITRVILENSLISHAP